MRRRPRQESFERFYYRNVGLGEACGCAERVIDMYEFDRLAARAEFRSMKPRMGIIAMLKTLGRAFRLLR